MALCKPHSREVTTAPTAKLPHQELPADGCSAGKHLYNTGSSWGHLDGCLLEQKKKEKNERRGAEGKDWKKEERKEKNKNEMH